MFSRNGVKAYKADLKNTIALCEFLGNPQEKIKTIHIAGTNGKGSVSHMLAAVLQENNYTTGLYTSPHLKDFRERIRINGEMIEESFVKNFVEKIRSVADEIKPSFFELTFAMAVDYFAFKKTDVAVIETGLGGRLDSTNVIHPLLSVITNISYDHMDILGDTLDKIAFEKAGIIKEDTPVVIGEAVKETKPVFETKAREVHAPIFFAGDHFEVVSSFYKTDSLTLQILNKDSQEQNQYTLDLNGIYQGKNIITVLESIDQLKNIFALKEDRIIKGLSQVKKLTGLFGRWEIIHENPTIVLDVAHNEDGIRQLLQQVKILPHHQLHIIFGMVKDKDPQKVLSQFPYSAKYYFTKAHTPRALPEDQLKNLANEFHLQGPAFENVNEAIHAALSKASANDLVIVCGSVFVIAEVLPISQSIPM